ncbi:hypothetical protein NITMOv2_0495 [Nitrospira moscoviensis]|uniref:Uncharacterized protein n=1 Tax=Nitrospira moscoviensis TaxID=42253 RepID=A0A0K2G7J3_NITMO|nr:hypothetical protein NITMOv2_0495 [Nitrospira moscoviensis]
MPPEGGTALVAAVGGAGAVLNGHDSEAVSGGGRGDTSAAEGETGGSSRRHVRLCSMDDRSTILLCGPVKAVVAVGSAMPVPSVLVGFPVLSRAR